MTRLKSTLQLIWGVALLAMGAALFVRTPQIVADRITRFEQYAQMEVYIYFCLYLISVLLIGGGAKKIYANYRTILKKDTDR